MTMPFRVAVIGDAFTDRADEMKRVLDTMRSSGRLVLYGERRLGKTAILRRSADRFAAEGGVAIYLDLWGAAQERDVLRSLAAQIPRSWLAGERLTQLLKTLPGMFAVSFDETGAPRLTLNAAFRFEDGQGFRELVEKLDQYVGEHGETVALIMDEFQKSDDRLSLPPSSLRSLAQNCPNLGFLFSGSAVGTISGLLGPDGPFLGYPALEVGPIETEHLALWIQSILEKHERTLHRDVSLEMVSAAYGITSYVLELANECWAQTKAGEAITDDTIATALTAAAQQRTNQFELLWDSVVATDRAILTAAAWGAEQLTSKAVRERFDLPTPSTVTSAVKKLRTEAFLRPRQSPQVADPFFAEWIRLRNPEPTTA